MKLVSLNIWGGKMGQVLLDFLCEQAKDTDIFCFQEAFNLTEGSIEKQSESSVTLADIQQALVGFKLHYHPIEDRVEYFAHPGTFGQFGLGMFIRQEVKVEDVDEIMIFRGRNSLEGKDFSTLGKNLQYAKITADSRDFLICNYHGIWTDGTKDDTENRLEQSRKIGEFLRNRAEARILCGDFNLNPGTESLRMLEQGMKNLVSAYSIKTTRSHLYRHKGQMEFADYTLVSSGVKVKGFQVPDVAVSDHLPMILEFE